MVGRGCGTLTGSSDAQFGPIAPRCIGLYAHIHSEWPSWRSSTRSLLRAKVIQLRTNSPHFCRDVSLVSLLATDRSESDQGDVSSFSFNSSLVRTHHQQQWPLWNFLARDSFEIVHGLA